MAREKWTAAWWELYTQSMDCTAVANALTKAYREIFAKQITLLTQEGVTAKQVMTKMDGNSTRKRPPRRVLALHTQSMRLRRCP